MQRGARPKGQNSLQGARNDTREFSLNEVDQIVDLFFFAKAAVFD
jgi:hypothetical protein